MKQTYKDYLLVCLAEECAEVIQCVTKIQRFGWDERNITESLSYPTNTEKLHIEFNDILAIVDLLQERLVKVYRDEGLIETKKQRTASWASHAVVSGKLDQIV